MSIGEWLFDIAMAPLNWAVTETVTFAVTAPYKHIYIAMGVAAVVAIALIWSMLPKKAKSHNIEPVVVTPYVATDEDEREARRILTEARAL